MQTQNPQALPGCRIFPDFRDKITAMPFIESVETFVEAVGIEKALSFFNDLIARHKTAEVRTLSSLKSVHVMIPKLEGDYQTVQDLKKKHEAEDKFDIQYMLTDDLYSTATIDPSKDSIYFWLGAKTMVEFTYDEAMDLLQDQIAKNKEIREKLQEELDFHKKQITMGEVSMSRLFNYDVEMKRRTAEAEKEEL
ncbi:hypothetical protein PCE1_000734 [Barthelona sp. PCE]